MPNPIKTPENPVFRDRPQRIEHQVKPANWEWQKKKREVFARFSRDILPTVKKAGKGKRDMNDYKAKWTSFLESLVSKNEITREQCDYWKVSI